jgi:multiple sugar transport system permease protein
MATIAVTAPTRPRSRFLLDRPELIGPLFIAPAILYVTLLVALPFFLAIYYSVSAFTIFDPSYRFVGLSNFLDVMKSEIFRRTLINTFIFTIGAQVIGLLLGKFAAMLLMQEFPGRGLARALVVLPWAVPVSLATLALAPHCAGYHRHRDAWMAALFALAAIRQGK